MSLNEAIEAQRRRPIGRRVHQERFGTADRTTVTATRRSETATSRGRETKQDIAVLREGDRVNLRGEDIVQERLRELKLSSVLPVPATPAESRLYSLLILLLL